MFEIKYRVIDLSSHLDAIKNQLLFEENQVRLLRAEEAYLKSPERLLSLVVEQKSLIQSTSKQMVKEEKDESANPHYEVKYKKVNWRYKSRSNHYKTSSMPSNFNYDVYR
jgi:hypothetical protein